MSNKKEISLSVLLGIAPLHSLMIGPGSALDEYVHALYLIRLPEGDPGDVAHQLVPMPGTHHWFCAGDGGLSIGGGEAVPSSAVVSGPQGRPLRVAGAAGQEIVVVALKPGALYRLTGLPQGDLLDVCSPAERLLTFAAECASSTVPLFAQQDDPLCKLRQVEQYLLGLRDRLRPATAFDSMLARLTSAEPSTISSIRELAAECHMELRQFERTSHLRLGFAPKVFVRLLRFAAAFRMKQREPAARWTEIALRCGYFDQMHFIRDFKRFAGFLPSALRQANEEGWCVA